MYNRHGFSHKQHVPYRPRAHPGVYYHHLLRQSLQDAFVLFISANTYLQLSVRRNGKGIISQKRKCERNLLSVSNFARCFQTTPKLQISAPNCEHSLKSAPYSQSQSQKYDRNLLRGGRLRQVNSSPRRHFCTERRQTKNFCVGKYLRNNLLIFE